MSSFNPHRHRSINQSDDQPTHRRNRSNYPVINSSYTESLIGEESDYQTNQHQRPIIHTESLTASDSGSSIGTETSTEHSHYQSDQYFDHSSDHSIDEILHVEEDSDEESDDSDSPLEQSDWSDSLFDCLIDGTTCCCSMLFPYLRWSLSVTRWFNQSVKQSLKQQQYEIDEPIKPQQDRSINAKIGLVFILSLLVYGILYGGLISLYVYLNTAFPQTFTQDGIAVYDTIYIIFLCVLLTVWVMLACVGGYFRGKMRRYFGIGGNCGEDFLTHAVCGCCAVAQEARHVDRDLGLIV